MKLLDRYLLRETAVPLAAGLGLFFFVLLMDRLFDLLDLTFNRGVSFLTVGRLMACFMPSVLAVALPMATLLASVLAFGRLAHDRELVAMKSAGLGLGRLMRPVLGLGAAFALVLLVFNGTVLPAATSAYKEIFLSIVRARASVAFQERVFIREFDRYLLYFDHKTGPEDELQDVTIVENPPSPPRIISARRGRLQVDREGYRVTLNLEDGLLDQPADVQGERYTRIEFAGYTVELDIHNVLRGGQFFMKGLDEMTYGELLRRMRDLRGAPEPRRGYEIAFHSKIALAFAPLFVVLLGAPLGSLARRGGGVGLTLSLVVIFAYYALLTVGNGLADRGRLPTVLALWLPNGFLAAVGGAAFLAASREARWIRWGR